MFEWFLPPELGGQGWSEEDVVRGYLALSEACLTTHVCDHAADRRLPADRGEREPRGPRPAVARPDRRPVVRDGGHLPPHDQRPALSQAAARGRADRRWVPARRPAPWVTGSTAADTIAIGATVVEGGEATTDELLIALPTDLPGVSVPEPFPLVGVSASATGPVELAGVEVSDALILAGPVEKVMTMGRGTTPGGHETSTLALGVATAAVKFLQEQAAKRADLLPAADSLAGELEEVTADLISTARGEPACAKELLRQRANSLVLRATQPPSPRPRVPATSSATRSVAGAARPCSSWSGAAPSR